MVPVPGYEFLPHTTDAYIQATGSTFEEALENAGKALFDTMCDLESISPLSVENVEAVGFDEGALVYNWLESLLLKFEIEHKVYSRFEVALAKMLGNSLELTAKAHGETYDKRKHGAKVEVKGVTYHKMEITRNGTTRVRFILDL